MDPFQINSSVYINAKYRKFCLPLVHTHASLLHVHANFDIRIPREWKKNTSSFPKFKIANYDVTRIHLHEQNVFTFVSILFRAYVKSALLQKVCMFLIICVLPALFTQNNRGQIKGGLVQRTKLLDHFLNGILVRKSHFSSLNVYKETPVKILPTIN